jgi:hypothetical protein
VQRVVFNGQTKPKRSEASKGKAAKKAFRVCAVRKAFVPGNPLKTSAAVRLKRRRDDSPISPLNALLPHWHNEINKLQVE